MAFEYAFEQEDCDKCSDMLGHILKEFGKGQKKTKMTICKICGDKFTKNINLPIKEHDAMNHKLCSRHSIFGQLVKF